MPILWFHIPCMSMVQGAETSLKVMWLIFRLWHCPSFETSLTVTGQLQEEEHHYRRVLILSGSSIITTITVTITIISIITITIIITITVTITITFS